jgi:uncharacterized protein (TIGR00255 family)
MERAFFFSKFAEKPMILSMTGYGRSTATLAGRKALIEIKVLNSKQLDLNLKIPATLRDKEMELRARAGQRIERGKADLSISLESSGEAPPVSVNRSLAKGYFSELSALTAELGAPMPPDILSQVLRMPDVMETGRDELTAADWESISKAFDAAMEQMFSFRREEGKILQDDILIHLEKISLLREKIGELEGDRLMAVKERLNREFYRYLGDSANPAPDQNRFEQELIYYLEKLDITEEMVRLEKHCSYFLNTLNETESQGKKLGFITQEMGREINTIGSKANDAEIQRLVVEMKDELEKIKEQLGNIL